MRALNPGWSEEQVQQDVTEWLSAIGQDSPFHEEFGYYADPVEEGTATLPAGWKGRLVNLAPGHTDGVRGRAAGQDVGG